MILSNETILTIIISITVSILLAGLCLNYYLQKKQNKISNEQNTIYFLSIENIKTGDLYEEFITMPVNNVCEDSIISSINYYKYKLIMNTNYKIEDFKIIYITRIN